MPANDNDPTQVLERHVLPVMITPRNCVLMAGASWRSVVRFAREHGVPIGTFGARTPFVSGPQLAAAVERFVASAAPKPEPTAAEARDAWRAKVAAAWHSL